MPVPFCSACLLCLGSLNSGSCLFTFLLPRFVFALLLSSSALVTSGSVSGFPCSLLWISGLLEKALDPPTSGWALVHTPEPTEGAHKSRRKIVKLEVRASKCWGTSGGNGCGPHPRPPHILAGCGDSSLSELFVF